MRPSNDITLDAIGIMAGLVVFAALVRILTTYLSRPKSKLIEPSKIEHNRRVSDCHFGRGHCGPFVVEGEYRYCIEHGEQFKVQVTRD